MEKNFHTVKSLSFGTQGKRLVFLSALFPGQLHDFTVFKELFRSFDFSGFRIHVDLGFLGIEKVVKTNELYMPHKKPPKKELATPEKAENAAFSRLRIVIEHAFAKLKSLAVVY